jgi:hypothetical protein
MPDIRQEIDQANIAEQYVSFAACTRRNNH